MPGVLRRLALDGATLLAARRDDAVVGFALCAPNPRVLELFYLAVDAVSWGDGVGAALLAAVDDHARTEGYDEIELWVIDDNTRATGVYRRAGWVPTDDVVADPTSGRDERRFTRRLT
ncbi:hypothetical protein ASC58_07015 [Phycicoccus sp. Root101]|nr:hypothetical protein ASC58_07015 [Phycicoccus sp. Root101]